MKNSLLVFVLLAAISGNAQSVQPKLKFDQGQTLQINMQLKTNIVQQAMGQAIDFNVEANADHSYVVTNTTEDNSTLRHSVDRVGFSFDGMGQKRNFNSNDEKDLNGNFGKPVKEVLEKKYDMVIDNNGNTLMAIPEKIVLANDDPRMAIINSMLKDVFDLVQPPKTGSGSFFRVLPDSGTVKGKPWTESYALPNGSFNAAYTISEITDSTIVIDFASNSATVTKAEMMGGETTTNMNNKSTGKIILDKATGIIREKTMKTDSNGATETAFGSLPVTSTTNITIKLK